MPEGYRHLTFDGRCRIYATGKSGLSNGAIARHPGRDPSTISPERGLFGPGEADGGALGEGRGEAGGGLEPGTGLGASPAGGPRHGRPSADIRPRTCGPQGRRNALRAPAAAGKGPGPAGRSPRGPGSCPGPEGHPGAPERGRGEGGDRRPGSGHGDRRGTRRCGGVAC